ncbi:PEP-CTERM sorting domain-containing protein [Akkermansia sp.]|uniref:PEP-CTERM sorting domain-containing protein n=1 Tax=Akkermansia sp. TaxID=1872421 RepID=UPI0025B9E61A|nr:PEP-CTERM sorting domain-containing protein [Akkermansia sp.]
MKKKLYLLAVTLLGISGGQAAVTLVSGFSRFDQTSPDSGTAVSDLGTKSLSWTLNDALWNNDGTWTSNATNSKKNGLDVSSLQLSGAAGYTVNINFSSAASLDNTDSLFCASIGGTGLNSIVGRYESGKIGIANNGSSSGRPASGLSSTAIDFNSPFSLTLSVQAGGAYSVFITQNGTTQTVSWPNMAQAGNLDQLYIGCWATLNGNQSSPTVSGLSFWEGAATQDDLAAIINVPEPATASLSLLGLGALLLRRRRK